MDTILAPIDKLITEIGRLMTVRPRTTGLILLLLVATWAGIFFFVSNKSHSTSDTTPLAATAAAPTVTEEKTAAATIANTITTSAPVLKQGNWKTVKVKKRDNLARIFKRLDIKQSDLAAIMALGSSTQALTHLHPGQELQVLVDNRQLEQLSFTNDGQNILVVTRSEQGFAAQTITNNTDTANNPPAVALTNATPEAASKTNTPSTAAPVPAKTAIIPNAIKSITLTINHSISEAVRRAGLSAKLANELSHVLSSNPSLIKQIHTGDKLALVYQKDQVADKKSLPNILIAELSSRHGKSLRLVRYTDPKGNTEYYTPQGYSLKPSILRAPLAYERISSYFSHHRWQPILHFFRPHEGIDYAARYGTPIKAAGDGKLAYVGVKGGYGNTVVIKHVAGYSTLYAHLSRYASKLKPGSIVHQGQIIGYVGSSGLATGAHLHYEIRLRNVPQNPLTVALPTGSPIPKAYRSQFLQEVQRLLAEYDSKQMPKLAAVKDDVSNES